MNVQYTTIFIFLSLYIHYFFPTQLLDSLFHCENFIYYFPQTFNNSTKGKVKESKKKKESGEYLLRLCESKSPLGAIYVLQTMWSLNGVMVVLVSIVVIKIAKTDDGYG